MVICLDRRDLRQLSRPVFLILKGALQQAEFLLKSFLGDSKTRFEGSSVKIAVTSHGPGPNSDVDENFGRAYWFVIYDDQVKNWHSFDNSAIRNSRENVGVKATDFLVRQGVDVVVTGEAGPRAFRSLKSKDIKVFLRASGSVEDMVKACLAGQLKEAEAANGKCNPFCLESLAGGLSHDSLGTSMDAVNRRN